MGTLTPGATYIYERVAGSVFARESGSSDRRLVGYTTSATPADTFLGMPVNKVAELVAISTAAEHNPALQEALERVKILYYLTMEDKNGY
jgi:hypothetical protein